MTDKDKEMINILLGGVQVAQKRGAYHFNESSEIGEAVNYFLNLSNTYEKEGGQKETIVPPKFPVDKEEQGENPKKPKK